MVYIVTLYFRDVFNPLDIRRKGTIEANNAQDAEKKAMTRAINAGIFPSEARAAINKATKP